MVLQFSQQMKRLLAVSVLIGFSSSTVVYAADTPSIPIVGPDGIVKTESVKRYGPVKQSDTLWRVASSIRPNNRVSVYQTMLALYLKNPTAFENGNINRLMKNAILLVPSTVEIASVTDAQAKAKLRADSKAKAPASKQQSTKPKQTVSQPSVKKQEDMAKPVTTENTKPSKPATTNTPSTAIPVVPTLTENVRIASLKSELEDSIASMEDILAANSRMDQQLKQLEQTVQQLQMQLQDQIKSNMMVTESLKVQVDTNRLDIEDSDSTSNLAFYLASGIGGLVLVITGVGVWLMRKSRKLAASSDGLTEQVGLAEADPLAEHKTEALDPSDADAVAALDQLAPSDENAPALHESLDLDSALDDDTPLPELGSAEDDVIHLDELDADDAPELPADDELIAQNDLPHEEEDELDINALLSEENDDASAQAEAEPFDPDAILSNMDLDALLSEDDAEPEPEPDADSELGALEPDADSDAANEVDVPVEPELPSDELEEEPVPESVEPESTADADVEPPSVDDDAATETADAEPVADDEPSIDMPDDIELGVDFDSLLNEPDPADVSNDGLEAVAAPDAEGGYIDIDQLLMEAESSDEGVEEFPGLEPHSNAETAEEEDGIAAKLDLARAYIEIGDFTVASDLLKEILQDGSDAQQAEANELLGRIDS